MPVFTNRVEEQKYVNEDAYQELLRRYTDLSRIFAAVIEQNGGELKVHSSALMKTSVESEIVLVDHPPDDVMIYRLMRKP